MWKTMCKPNFASRIDGLMTKLPLVGDMLKSAVADTWAGRVVWLPGYIDSGSMSPVAESLTRMAGQALKPVALICDSRGGDGTASVEFAAFLRALPVPVVTIVQNQAMSAAVLIFAAGKLRVMESGATLMTHGARVADTNANTDELADIMENQVWAGSGFRLDRSEDRMFKAAMNRYAGQRLPDVLYGKEFLSLPFHHACGLGLADREGIGLGYASWQRARQMLPT